MMTENFEICSQNWNSMIIRLKEPAMLDPGLLESSETSDLLLSCMITDRERGMIVYTTKNLIPLRAFLANYTFTRTEGYQFLIDLLEKAVCLKSIRPIALSLDSVYVSAYGDEIYFCALPVSFEYWMFQQKDCEQFIEGLCSSFNTEDSYEIIGYMKTAIRQEAFSLTSVMEGLRSLEEIYYPRSFWKRNRPYPAFRARDPIRVPAYEQDVFESVPDPDVLPRLPRNSRNENHLQPSLFEEDRMFFSKPDGFLHDTGINSGPVFPDELEAPTQIISDLKNPFWIESGQSRVSIEKPVTVIGRNSGCDLVLNAPDVSGKHARIVQENGRCYLIAESRTNGTWLDGRRVTRKMRLKDGMKIRFSTVEGVFHEDPV